MQSELTECLLQLSLGYFCIHTSYLKLQRLKCTELLLYFLVCVGMELGLLAVNEEHGLTMFEKRLRREKFGPERGEVT